MVQQCKVSSGLQRQTIGVLLLLAFYATVSAQTSKEAATIKLSNPTCVTIQPLTGDSFFVEQTSGRLLRWSESALDVVVQDVRIVSEYVQEFVGLTLRGGNRVTLLGVGQGGPALATWAIHSDKPATYEEGLSGQLDFDDDDVVSGIASTDLAVFIVTNAGASGSIWKIDAGRATLGKAKRIYTAPNRNIKAITVSQQGHLAVAWVEGGVENRQSDPAADPSQSARTTGSIVLGFHHAETGQPITQVHVDAKQIRSISFGARGLLYATGTSAVDVDGLFRLDAAFADNRPVVRVTPVMAMPNAIGIACATPPQRSVVLTGGESGNGVRIDLN